MDFSASDVLLKAASRIEEEGMWCQQYFFADMPSVDNTPGAWYWAQHARSDFRVPECAMGALLSATVDLGLTFADYRQAETRLANFVIERHGNWISEWNDQPERTADEVAQTMRNAAL